MLSNYENFKELITDLFTHFNRTATKLTCQVWFSYLSNYLDDKQLIRAISLSLVEDKTLPTAKELMEKINGKHSDIYEKAWLELVSLAQTYSSTAEVYGKINLSSFYALQKIGGIAKIASADKWELKDLRELFLMNLREIETEPEAKIKSKINFSFLNNLPTEVKEKDLITPEQMGQLRQMIKKSTNNFGAF